MRTWVKGAPRWRVVQEGALSADRAGTSQLAAAAHVTTTARAASTAAWGGHSNAPAPDARVQ